MSAPPTPSLLPQPNKFDAFVDTVLDKFREHAPNIFNEALEEYSAPPKDDIDTWLGTTNWKDNMTPEEIAKYEPQLNKLKNQFDSENITIQKILDVEDMPDHDRMTALSMFSMMHHIDPDAEEYMIIKTQLQLMIQGKYTPKTQYPTLYT